MYLKTKLVEKSNDMNKDEKVKFEILEAARKVFQKWGINKTTMEDIAAESGKGKSTLYYYFKSKHEIFEEIAQNEIQKISNIALNKINLVMSPKEKLKNYLTSTLTELKNTVSLYPLVMGEVKGNKEIIEKIRNQWDQKEESILKDILKAGIKSDEINFINYSELDKAANVMVGIVRGLFNYLFLDNEDIEKIDIATRIISGYI